MKKHVANLVIHLKKKQEFVIEYDRISDLIDSVKELLSEDENSEHLYNCALVTVRLKDLMQEGGIQ